ncbi:alpha/beta family hydrolase [Cobetia crustatorum]|uniref:Dienelactone hydrolase n=1 Tax=Cobetia crustatorum TaxID=553385 RepID=A0A558HUQ5_9GAMM|nr:alpha/beta family hydrolase [Cobetia crustatorum]TVU72854.1 dienelactone hydrolase [Cobetia crustatorum]
MAEAPFPYEQEGFCPASLEEVAIELAMRITLSEVELIERGPWRGWIASLGSLEIHGSPRRAILLHAHGAGGGRETGFHQQFGVACAREGMAWLAFDFGYLVQMRREGKRRPPPRLPGLIDEMAQWCEALAPSLAALGGVPLLVGGKSMGSRVASHLMQALAGPMPERCLECSPIGWYALGYPFHPTGKPEKLRIAHLPDIDMPGLICQGTRDPFGTQEDVQGYALPERVTLHWLQDGEHDFKPRRSSGETQQRLIASAAHVLAHHPALG